MDGKIFIYLRNNKVNEHFLKDAQEQGYAFGQIRPVDSGYDQIVVLKRNKQLSHAGFIGRIEFQTNGGDNPAGPCHRIDYEKYIRGEADYYVKRDG